MADPWKLSERETEVLNLLVKADGPTNKQIGRMLGISDCTVDVHMATACRKLGADNRLHAALMWDRLLRGCDLTNKALAVRLLAALGLEGMAA